MARVFFAILIVALASVGAIFLTFVRAPALRTRSATAAVQPGPGPAGTSQGRPEDEQTGGRTLIVLKNGNQLSGDVLKERADSLVLDLGFTIISIPVEDILERRTASRGDVALSSGTAASRGQIYTEADPRTLKDRLVKDLADELGGSVGLVSSPAGIASCFAIDDQGYFVTNFHVIQGEQEINITLSRKGEAGTNRVKIEKVRIVALSPFLDLALLKADPPPGVLIRPLPLGFSDSLQNGQTVFAIGNPLGLERTISQGIISATRRSFEGQLFLQTTAAVNPGNSGGPLFNLRGEVVGITSMKAGLFSEGLGFAIPVDTLKSFLRDRDVYAFDKDNPNNGYRYLPPPRKPAAKPAE